MNRLIWYLSKLFVSIWLVVAFGLVVLAGLLDSLANAPEITASDEGGALYYMWLRAPVIFDQVFPFTLMLSLLLCFVTLIRRNELVALQGVGLSVFAQVRALAPVVLAVSFLAMAITDARVPHSVQSLNDWGIGEYQGGNVSDEEPLWLNDKGTFVRMKGRDGLSTLTDLTFYQRNDAAQVTGVTWAARAEYTGNGWALQGLSSLAVDGADPAPELLTFWDTDQTPLVIDKLAADPRNLSIKDLRAFAAFRGSGSRPSVAYRVWLIKRLTLPLTALALLLVAAPIMQRLGRRDTGTMSLIVGVGMTFLFMIFDGIMVTMGAAGAFPDWPAALGVTVLFGGIGLYLWLDQEMLR
ncbi:MAG: LptF/LptG family permease [Hyphomonadaceae bacterium]